MRFTRLAFGTAWTAIRQWESSAHYRDVYAPALKPFLVGELAVSICEVRHTEGMWRPKAAGIVPVIGPQLDVPMYAPEKKERAPRAAKLVDLFRRCDGLIIASPAYHGSVSGLLKNALGQTLGALRAIAHSIRGWPTPLGAMLNTSVRLFEESCRCLDLSAKLQLQTVGRQVVQFARMKAKLLGERGE